MGLAYEEIINVLDVKYFPSKRTGYTLQPVIYGISDINRTLDCFLPIFVKISFTIDDIRLRSNLNINQTIIFFKKNFF